MCNIYTFVYICYFVYFLVFFIFFYFYNFYFFLSRIWIKANDPLEINLIHSALKHSFGKTRAQVIYYNYY